MSSLVAVLTGDLIGSTKAEAGEVERAMGILAKTAARVSGWQTPATDTRLTRFRGDGWQMVLGESPELALRAAIVLQASLRAVGSVPGTRVAVGYGSVTFAGTNDLSDASGTAFERSGHALDTMGRIRRLAVNTPGLSSLNDIIFDLIDERMTRWTPEQAEAVALYFHPDAPTLAEIASPLSISSQAVSYRLNGAGATRLKIALQNWEDEMESTELAKLLP